MMFQINLIMTHNKSIHDHVRVIFTFPNEKLQMDIFCLSQHLHEANFYLLNVSDVSEGKVSVFMT